MCKHFPILLKQNVLLHHSKVYCLTNCTIDYKVFDIKQFKQEYQTTKHILGKFNGNENPMKTV